MVEIKLNLLRKEKWFCSKIYFFDVITLVNYKQAKKKKPFFYSEDFYTFLINLELSIDEIKKELKSNYRNEINKASTLNMLFSEEENVVFFKNFYNSFAKKKSLPLLSNNFDFYIPHCKITKVEYEGKVIAMHVYLLDKEDHRVRLLYSSSDASFYDRKIIGIANKFLHLEDIIFFKQIGFKIYDLGGVDMSSKDKHIQGINSFKKGFGGTLSLEYNLTSYPLYLLRKIL